MHNKGVSSQLVISMITAMTPERVIGRDNQLPWHLPADLQHFKKHTLNKSILMGRRTYESIGKPLPNRHNIILTKQTDFHADDCDIVNSLEHAIDSAKMNADNQHNELMVIGGAQLYQLCLPYAKRLYLTIIHGEFSGDAFFPEHNLDEWQQMECVEREADDNNPYRMTFLTLENLNKNATYAE